MKLSFEVRNLDGAGHFGIFPGIWHRIEPKTPFPSENLE